MATLLSTTVPPPVGRTGQPIAITRVAVSPTPTGTPRSKNGVRQKLVVCWNTSRPLPTPKTSSTSVTCRTPSRNEPLFSPVNCYDNATMESFWTTLKPELVYRRCFDTRAQARTQIFDYIETFYNRQRAHSALDYQSPVDFELINN